MTTANQLNLDSLDRKPCAIGGLSRSRRGRIPEPVWQSQRMRRCVGPTHPRSPFAARSCLYAQHHRLVNGLSGFFLAVALRAS